MGDGLRLEILAEAADEARAARLWYATTDESLGTQFMASLDDAIAKVIESPTRWPLFLHGTRRYWLKRFPYVVVYQVRRDRVQVVAIQHARRRPGYWHERLK